MALNSNDNILDKMVSTLVSNHEASLRQAVELMYNHAMKVERSAHLQAKPYEHTEQRVTHVDGYTPNHANGFKPKQLDTAIAVIFSLDIYVYIKSIVKTSLNRPKSSQFQQEQVLVPFEAVYKNQVQPSSYPNQSL